MLSIFFLFFPISKSPTSLNLLAFSVSVSRASPYLTVRILLHVTTLYILKIISLYQSSARILIVLLSPLYISINRILFLSAMWTIVYSV